MHYPWINSWNEGEDPDACITKLCHLGLYLLELTEDYWEGEELFMTFNVYQWNNQEKEWEELETNLKPQVYNRKTSHIILENWYAENVLLEEHFGSADEIGKR